jgi:hypothetical protein
MAPFRTSPGLQVWPVAMLFEDRYTDIPLELPSSRVSYPGDAVL